MATGRFRVPKGIAGWQGAAAGLPGQMCASWSQLMGYILVATAACEQLQLLPQSRLEPERSDKEKAESSPQAAEQGPWHVLSSTNTHLGGDAEKRHRGPFIFNNKCHLILIKVSATPTTCPSHPHLPGPTGTMLEQMMKTLHFTEANLQLFTLNLKLCWEKGKELMTVTSVKLWLNRLKWILKAKGQCE